MPTLAIVEDCNVSRDLLPGLFPCFIPPVAHEFILLCVPETLHRRVVVAVSRTRHQDAHSHVSQLGLVGIRTISGAAIGTMTKLLPRALGGEGFPERP